MKRKILIIGSLAAAAAIMITALLFYNGIIWFNGPSSQKYAIKGVDVSAYQGEINWEVLSRQGIDFAFIKATEGSSFQDKKFAYNWEHAGKTKLKTGAYHFFSFDSPGLSQAENFINTVQNREGILPPVVDVEFYNDKEKNPPDKESVNRILSELLLKLEEHYDKKPIIYATKKSYDLYIQDDYPGYPIWIRDVITKPVLSDGREWTFWQYSNRKVLKGYKGVEKYIDMNVFNGTEEEFINFVQ